MADPGTAIVSLLGAASSVASIGKVIADIIEKKAQNGNAEAAKALAAIRLTPSSFHLICRQIGSEIDRICDFLYAMQMFLMFPILLPHAFNPNKAFRKM